MGDFNFKSTNSYRKVPSVPFDGRRHHDEITRTTTNETTAEAETDPTNNTENQNYTKRVAFPFKRALVEEIDPSP